MFIIARSDASRKWLLTINNPLNHDLSHENIKSILNENFKGVTYWCMCDEIGGEEHTYHTHVCFYSPNAIEFSHVKRFFEVTHIDKIDKGYVWQSRDYIRKEGKFKDTDKSDTNLIETFEEYGDLPNEIHPKEKQSEIMLQMIKDGCSDSEILDAFPSAYRSLNSIRQARQVYLKESQPKGYKKKNVIYIYGDTGIGKSRFIYENFGDSVYTITDYNNPFDDYENEKVIVFEEFDYSNANISITKLNQITDGYPLKLSARYNNKIACFDTVIFLSNMKLEKQYVDIQKYKPKQWDAFMRRLDENYYTIENGKLVPLDLPF